MLASGKQAVQYDTCPDDVYQENDVKGHADCPVKERGTGRDARDGRESGDPEEALDPGCCCHDHLLAFYISDMEIGGKTCVIRNDT